uniref:Uncharacterized protein n=1 Tax=Sus scrofa TaxID=9823 RepID=A0A4X1V7G5_PIG
MMFYNRNELYSYSKFNIYKKLQQTNASTQNLPLHSDSLSPTQPLPSLQPPAGSPRRGNHIKGTFKETAPLIFPTTSSGLRRYQRIPLSGKLLVFQVFKNQENVFPRGPGNEALNSKLSAESYKIFLSEGKWLTRLSGTVRLYNSHPDCKLSTEKCKRTPDKLIRNCHCLIKAAGQFWKESFTPHLKFPQKRTQTHILKLST